MKNKERVWLNFNYIKIKLCKPQVSLTTDISRKRNIHMQIPKAHDARVDNMKSHNMHRKCWLSHSKA